MANDGNMMNEAPRAAGGDQWMHNQIDDYMVYQSLNVANGAQGDGMSSKMPGEAGKAGSTSSGVTCHLCDKTYSNKAHLSRHMQNHSTVRPYKCDVCQLAFSNTGRLKRHKETHSGVKAFKCNLCDAKLSRKDHLKRHMIIHTESRPYKCSLCPFTAKRIDGIKHHNRQKHLNENVGPVTALHLDPSAMQNLLDKFQPSSSGQFLSDGQQVSGKSKKKKKKKKSKAAANGAGVPSLVPMGGQAGQPQQQHDELLSLILNNTPAAEGQVPCDMCDKSFADQTKLNRHKLSHLAVKPFGCDICGARLSRQDHLKRHMYMHEVSHPLICGSCRYATNKLRDLREHIKSQHPGERIRILSSNNNGQASSDKASDTTGSPEKRDGGQSSKQVTGGAANTSLADPIVLPQGESIYSAGTWCPSTGDAEASDMPMSKRKRKNPQKCQTTAEGMEASQQAGLASMAGKDGGNGGWPGSDLSLRMPPGGPLMVPSYNLMHNAAQYNLAAEQAWKQPVGMPNLGMNYPLQPNGASSGFGTANRGGGSRGDGNVMDLRQQQQQQGQFDNGQQSMKHGGGHCSGGAGKSSKSDKLHNNAGASSSRVDNRHSPPPSNIDNSGMHQLGVSSRLLTDASLRSGLPRVNDMWGAHFADKAAAGWLRMPNAQGFATPFFNNGMPNFVFNWPLQQGLPISPAGRVNANIVDKFEPNRHADSGVGSGPGVHNSYELADISGQPSFFGQGWPSSMNPY